MANLIPLQLAKILYHITKDVKGKEQETAIDAFILLTKKEQMFSKMPYIIQAFETYTKEQEGTTLLEIQSAKKISKQLQQDIETKFGNDVETTKIIDETLIGGVVVKAGNTILDGSVKKQLQNMKSTI